MVATGFRDYSDILVPLPSLNGKQIPLPRDFNNSSIKKFSESLNKAINKKNGATIGQSDSLPVNKLSEDNKQSLLNACKEFEGYFISILLKDLGKRMMKGGIFGNSMESSIYQDMFFSEIAKYIGKGERDLGIGRVIFNDIIVRMSEKS